MKKIVRVEMDRECAKIVTAHILNEFGHSLDMLSDVISRIVDNLERQVKQIPAISANIDNIVNKARELCTEITILLKKYEDMNKDDKLYDFVVVFALTSLASAIIKEKGQSLSKSVANYVMEELGGIEDKRGGYSL